MAPTLFDQVDPGPPVHTDEIFGPVMSVVRVASYEEGLALINANFYGNGTAIHTKARARPAASRTRSRSHRRARPRARRVLLLRRLDELR
ncbi:aldehyde dehydrogenase family protein [Streptomyces sp. NPDC021356]|uniref:aldehyde dehydrogenase family protein n=1 Tax=Streptomyces sp. NPDC021356 TaxID=3154900 RepID=UPI0033E96557